MYDCIIDLKNIKTDCFLKVYAKSFLNFPAKIKDFLITRILKYVEVMTLQDEIYVENWDMEK